MTGGGAGLFLLPPLLQWMIDTYGWRAAYCLLGAVSLNWTPAAATIFNTNTTGNQLQIKSADAYVSCAIDIEGCIDR